MTLPAPAVAGVLAAPPRERRMCDHARMTGRRPPRRRPTPRGLAVLAGLAPLALAAAGIGCAASDTPRPPETVIREVPPEVSVDGRPVALVDGVGVPWSDLRPRLLEAAGAEVLRDWILDRRLRAALLDAGIRVSSEMVAAEQDELLARLAEDPDRAARLLADLRDRRRLGPGRYEALLRRNAGLRALVAPTVTVTEAQVRAAFDVAHGPRRQVRIMTLPGLDAAAAARAEIGAGRSFAEVAAERSTDLSAARGGLLEPFSRLDPAMPASIRRAAFALEAEGDVSTPVLLPDGAALLELVATIEGDGTTWDEGRADAARAARLAAERVAMEEAARELTGGATITILDPALRDAWERRRRRVRTDR